jgi:hypothetical protein
MLMFVFGPPRERPIAHLYFPLFGAGCSWCARPMVESMIRYSRSGFSPSNAKSRFQTPFCRSPETTTVKRVAQSPLNETARVVGRCGKWRRGYQAPDLPSDRLASLPQRKRGCSACTQSVAPATTEQSSIGRSLITPHVYVTVFSSKKIDADEDAAIILDDV